MRVLIVGAGIVGYTLADQLSREKHDIYVIEKNAELIREMNDNLDVFAMCGSGTSQNTLEAIGIQDMDLMIAVSTLDEVNILSCLMASRYGVKKLVARVKNPEIVTAISILNKESVGVDLFINATSIIVEMIERLIEVPGCTDVATISSGQVQIRGFSLPPESRLVGQTVHDLQLQLVDDAFTILALTREGKTVIPDGKTLLQSGDRILVLLATHSLPMFLPLINRRVDEIRKIVLFGASQTCIELARRLEDRYEQILILEPDAARCLEVAKVLKKPLVIKGSALDKGTLDEIGVGTVDVFACLGEKDEDNYMAAMMAKQYGAKRTVVLVEKPAYLQILEHSAIDIIINPRLITVGKILQFLRRGEVLSAVKLIEGEAEVLEYRIADDSPIVGKKVRRLKENNLLPPGARLACLLNGDLVIVPDDETVIQAGQTVVVFSLPEALDKVQDLLSGKKWKLH